MTANTPANANQILQACQKWLDTIIIAHDFCPFAKRERDREAIRYSLAASPKLEQCLQMVADELIYLDDNPGTETSLLIFAEGFEDFDIYLELLELGQEVLASLGYEGRYQLASFHPSYCFEGCGEDDVENYTNRSPYPLLHLLREESLTVAIDNHPDPESIPQRNIDLTKENGLDKHKTLLADCFKTEK